MYDKGPVGNVYISGKTLGHFRSFKKPLHKLVNWAICVWSADLLSVLCGFYEWISHRGELRHLAHTWKFSFLCLKLEMNPTASDFSWCQIWSHQTVSYQLWSHQSISTIPSPENKELSKELSFCWERGTDGQAARPPPRVVCFLS